MTRETLIQAERFARIEKDIERIKKFLDDEFNYYWITDTKIKENPQPVKATGIDYNKIRLEATGECPECFPGKPGKRLIDCAGSAGFETCACKRNESLRNLAAREAGHTMGCNCSAMYDASLTCTCG